MHNNTNIPYQQARDGNRALWDEITPVHLKSYGVERFLAGERWLPLKIQYFLRWCNERMVYTVFRICR
jgi:hypothetical protein